MDNEFSEINNRSLSLMDIIEKTINSVRDTPAVRFTPDDKFTLLNTEMLDNMIEESKSSLNFEDILPIAETINKRINMRTQLIDWLKQVNCFRKTSHGVLAVTVEMIDQYVSATFKKTKSLRIDASNYQPVGSACYQIASKLEDVSPIQTKQLTKFTNDGFSPEIIKKFEQIILSDLNYKCRFITPIDFIYKLVNSIDIDIQKRNILIDRSVESYISVIEAYSIKKFPAHYLGLCSIINELYNIREIGKLERTTIINKLLKLLKLEMEDIAECHNEYTELFKDDVTSNGY